MPRLRLKPTKIWSMSTPRNYETKPKETIRKIIQQTQAEEAARLAKSNQIQTDFVNTHPSYVANSANGTKLAKWVETHGFSEFTNDNLNKAFQDLFSASGLLELKAEEAGAATEADVKDTGRTDQASTDATQQRSHRTGSTISTKTRPVSQVKTTAVSDDEAYKMPLDELRKLADKQLRERNQS